MENTKSYLKEKLTEYINRNNEYNEYHEHLTRMRQEKAELENEIIEFMKENNMNHKLFALNEYKIQHKSNYIYQNLSLKFVESTLQDYCRENNIALNIEKCLEFIKDKRIKKEKDELKIQIN